MLPESSEGYERKQDNYLQWEVLAKLHTQLIRSREYSGTVIQFGLIFVHKPQLDCYLESSYL